MCPGVSVGLERVDVETSGTRKVPLPGGDGKSGNLEKTGNSGSSLRRARTRSPLEGKEKGSVKKQSLVLKRRGRSDIRGIFDSGRLLKNLLGGGFRRGF